MRGMEEGSVMVEVTMLKGLMLPSPKGNPTVMWLSKQRGCKHEEWGGFQAGGKAWDPSAALPRLQPVWSLQQWLQASEQMRRAQPRGSCSQRVSQQLQHEYSSKCRLPAAPPLKSVLWDRRQWLGGRDLGSEKHTASPSHLQDSRPRASSSLLLSLSLSLVKLLGWGHAYQEAKGTLPPLGSFTTSHKTHIITSCSFTSWAYFYCHYARCWAYGGEQDKDDLLTG